MRNELAHHGILGMKWGIRRYRNADGTLTEEGKMRYGYEEDKDAMLQDLARMEKSEKQAKRTAVAVGAAAVAGLAGAMFLRKKLYEAKALSRLGSVVVPHITNVEFMLN